MPHAFGHKFIVLNDIQQVLPAHIFRGGPWLHLCTFQRGFKEYCAFRHVESYKMFIEEVDIKEPGLFKQIADEEEWKDAAAWLEAAGYTQMSPKEFKVAKDA